MLSRPRYVTVSLILLAVLLGLTGCQSPQPKQSSAQPTNSVALRRFNFQQPHMGTMFSMSLYAPDEVTANQASDAAFARILVLNRIMSDYDPESELMQLCQKPYGQPVKVSDDLFHILEKSQHMAELSDGAFDVTIGPVVRLWRRTRRTGELPSADALAHAREPVGWRKLKLDRKNKTVTLTVPNMQLDLGGIGKGYAADQALQVLKAHGITRALVAASGDIAVGDAPPGERGWRVGIGMLDGKTSDLARNLLLKNATVSTSGDREQFVEIGGKRYSHIVDPRTGIGMTERLQVSVVAKHGEDSDSFDTAISVMGAESGLALIDKRSDLAAFILRKHNKGVDVIESRRWKRIPVVESERN